MSKPIPEHIIDQLHEERVYQLEKGRKGKLQGPEEGWSYAFDDKNTPSDWASFINIYLGRAVTTAAASGFSVNKDFRTNMLKVAALAIAAIEAVDRNETLSLRHFDQDPNA